MSELNEINNSVGNEENVTQPEEVNAVNIPAEEVSEKEVKKETKSADSDETVDFSDEEASLAAEADEFNLGEETDVEEESAITANYSAMSKGELLAAFDNLLQNRPVETLRKDVEAIKSAFYKIHRQEVERLRKEFIDSGVEGTFVAPEDKDEILFKSLFAQYKEKRGDYMRNQDAQKEENYKKKLKLIDELKELIDNESADFNQSFERFKEIQAAWREIGLVPQVYVKNLWDTYHHHVEKFYDYVKINKDLRDLDLRKNLEAKIDLCEKAEALLLEPIVSVAFRKLQKLHEEWREIGPVPNEQREQIWERFKEATSKVNKKHQEYFETQKEEQVANLEAKRQLCEKAEQLSTATYATHKEWVKSSKELIALQEAWKGVGFAPKKENGKVYERFRTACDKYFIAKREFYKVLKQEMQVNLQKKVVLCEQAEALANSEDWKKTTNELIALQKQWKEIGAVPHKASDAVWKRFRAACDTFFANKGNHFSSLDTAYLDNLKEKESIIAEINAYVPVESVEANFEALKEFQRRFSLVGFVPIKEKERIQKEYREAVDKQFHALKISDSDRKAIQFKNKLESIQGESGKGGVRALRSEREKLLSRLNHLENDIAVWENNIGFFAKSKKADSMIAEVERKIARARDEIKELEEKIKLIDEQYNAQ